MAPRCELSGEKASSRWNTGSGKDREGRETSAAGEAELGRAPGGGRLRPAALAPVLALLSCVLFCVNGELLQALQLRMPASERHPSPMLNLLLCHIGGLVFVPHFGNFDRTFGAPNTTTGLASGAPGGGLQGYLSARPRLAALLFAALLMGYNYAWLSSTRFVSVSITNAAFQASVGFVYAASVPLFGEALRVSRVVGVGVVLFGSMMAGGVVGLPPYHPRAAPNVVGQGVGTALAILAAVGVAVYQVCFRHLFGHLKHDVRFLAFFSAWISIWHIVVMLPLVLIANATGLETMVVPSGRIAVFATLLTAAIASTVNLLYLCIALWGSPMLLPCASVLAVPLTLGLDVLLHGVVPTAAEACGHILVVLAVVLILNLHEVLRGGTDTTRAGVMKSALNV